ncbi:MAG: CPBP family intramembrane metalloprotease, partial [Clostridiales bacterium]|nr:CPBP family intramembrane metalloprotease [Clostridiales bacterium]
MQNKYSKKDSALSFILSLVIPNVLAFLAIFFLSFFMGTTNIVNTKIYKILATTLSQVSFLLIFLFILKTKKLSLKESLETKRLNIKQVLILITISLICLFLISPIINVFDSFLEFIGVTSSELPININKPINFIYLILTMGIFAPITEEILFRGVIFGGLKNKGNKFAIIISSLMFMLIHLNLHQTIYQFVLGIILALVVMYTNNIFSSILIHFINNTFVLVINYINPQFLVFDYLSLTYIIISILLFIFAV